MSATYATLRTAVWLAVTLFGLLATAPAVAHENLPIVLTLREAAPGEFAVTTRLPGTVELSQAPAVAVGAPCKAAMRAPSASLFTCPRQHRPPVFTLEWPGAVPASAILVRSEFLDGTSHAKVAPPGSIRIALPQAETPWAVVTSYVRIGAEHIVFGIDHLLFLVLLVLVAGTARRTVLTVTGFTVGHAATITLASLAIVPLDSAVVEALIALSIVFVAVELARRKSDTLLSRHPALVAAAFGTLHGLGFAGALSEIGLAQTSVVLSLIGFNLGVEAGQLLFVALVFALMTLGRRLSGGNQPENIGVIAKSGSYSDFSRVRTAIVSGVGVIASFWFWERTVALAG